MPAVLEVEPEELARVDKARAVAPEAVAQGLGELVRGACLVRHRLAIGVAAQDRTAGLGQQIQYRSRAGTVWDCLMATAGNFHQTEL